MRRLHAQRRLDRTQHVMHPSVIKETLWMFSDEKKYIVHWKLCKKGHERGIVKGCRIAHKVVHPL
jgi:hypothetical protein